MPFSLLEMLSSFPDEVKRALGFSLRQLQIGRETTSQTRSMSSVGSGVYELKETDEALPPKVRFDAETGEVWLCILQVEMPNNGHSNQKKRR